MPQQPTSGSAITAHADIPSTTQDVDLVFRAAGSSMETLQIQWQMPTATFTATFHDFLATLLEIIRGQGRQLEYEGYYISYLLGNLTEEEFETVSSTYVTETQDTPFEQLKDKVRVLTALKGHDITVQEMAQYLRCDEESIERALQLLQG